MYSNIIVKDDLKNKIKFQFYEISSQVFLPVYSNIFKDIYIPELSLLVKTISNRE